MIISCQDGLKVFDYKSDEEKIPRAISFGEAYEKIVAKPKEKALPLSEDFWKNYVAVLEYAHKSKQNNKDSEVISKAIHVLKTLLGQETESLMAYVSFISSLIEDLTHYRTLSEYAVRKIVEWEKHVNDENKLVEAIEELRREIGENFIEEALKPLRGILEKREVIIAIENHGERL